MPRVITKLYLYLFAAICALATFAGVALAAGAAEPPDGTLVDLARPIVDYVLSGHYLAASAAALVVLVAGLRRYGAKRLPFLGSAIGGAVLTLFGAFGATVAVAAAGSTWITMGQAWLALKIALTAAGGYSLLKVLIEPLVAKAPAWAQPILRLVTWIFDDHAAAAAVVADAEAAGAAAVVAKPAPGIKSSIGEATELK